MRSSSLNHDALEDAYRNRYDTVLTPLAKALADHISDCFQGQPRIDRISARAKNASSFMNKAGKVENGRKKYSEPLDQIQDQVGARITTFFRSDVDKLDKIVSKYFTGIKSKMLVPDSEWEFGYFGKHHVLVIPNDIVNDDWDRGLVPQFFELQIKTLFQHAWSEAEHDIAYKQWGKPLTLEEKRCLAFTSAQAWGADLLFDELFKKLTAVA